MSFPDLESLRILTIVGSSASLSDAARRAGSSQQAVSARMTTLESQLGLTLLARTSHGTTLTDAGRVVVEWAEELVAAAERFEAATESLAAPAAPSLSVAASLTIAEHLAPRWLVELRSTAPSIRLEMTAANSAKVFDLVAEGSADVGFVETPDIPAEVHSQLIAVDELVVVVSPDHPWARRERPVSPAELARAPRVSREHGSGTRLVVERALVQAGHPPTPPVLELSSSGAIRAALAGGELAAVLSIVAVREQLANGSLVKIPLSGVRMTRPLTAVRLPGAVDSDQAVEALLEIAQRVH